MKEADYRIVADGADITSMIRKRLIILAVNGVRRDRIFVHVQTPAANLNMIISDAGLVMRLLKGGGPMYDVTIS